MSALIEWLIDAETLAEKLYAECAKYFSDDRDLSDFLSSLSKDEGGHRHIVTNLNHEIGLPSDIPIEFSDDFKTTFITTMNNFILMLEKKTITKDSLLQYLVDAEFSEWNDVFVFMARQYAHTAISHQFDVAMMQKHISRISQYLEKAKNTALLQKIAAIQKVWEYRVMVVDDEEGIRDLFAMMFGRKFRTVCASNGRDAFDLMEQWHSDVIITDIDMPYMNGIELYEKLYERDNSVGKRMIFMTGNERHVIYFKEHGLRYFLKPFKIDELRTLVDSILFG